MPPGRALLAGPGVLVLAFVLWVADAGFDGYLVDGPVGGAASSVLVDAGTPGPFVVRTLSYGSGTSTRRPEYGAGADLLTSPVDGSPIFGGYGGLAGSFFRWYWGFDFTALPLNGLVWYPEGEGPFPLVLVVHGNHAMSEASEPGYAYLGEHLASHGYVVAAIDQNFLNGLMFFDGDFAEMPLRAWMVLQHLQQWRRWSATPMNVFSGRVDLGRVALIGHSRGGEAVAWAAHLNRHALEPVGRVSSPSDFGFGIQTVVAIAPSDAYEGAGGRKPAMMDADYLLLAGGHDADTFMLYGQAQYNRAVVGGEGVKALAYVYRANHGQFNGVWGSSDRGLFNSLLLNRAPLLSEDAQQRIAKALVTSFLDASVRDQAGSLAPFRNPSPGGEGRLVTQLHEAATVVLEDFEEGGARSEPLLQRDGRREQGNRALRLTWAAGTGATHEILLAPVDAARGSPRLDHALTFALANVPGAGGPADVLLELATADGSTVRMALSDAAPLVAPLPAHLVKARWLYGLHGFPGGIDPEEVVLQTYHVPLTVFERVDPRFDPAALTAIRFVFEGEVAGGVYLDEIAWVPASVPAPTTASRLPSGSGE